MTTQGRIYAKIGVGQPTAHELLFPPHLDGLYTSSALCSCGHFQWDASNAETIATARDQVIGDWRKHVADDLVTRNTWRRP
jgi:hypothetical protein